MCVNAPSPSALPSLCVCLCVCVYGGGITPHQTRSYPTEAKQHKHRIFIHRKPTGWKCSFAGGAQQPPGQETCLLPDLGCPGKGWEAAGGRCQRQSHRQVGLPGISLYHPDWTHMVKLLPIPAVTPALMLPTLSALPRHGLPVCILSWQHRFSPASMNRGDPPAQPAGVGPSPVEEEEETHVVYINLGVTPVHLSCWDSKGPALFIPHAVTQHPTGHPERKEALLIRSGAFEKIEAEGGIDFFLVPFFCL